MMIKTATKKIFAFLLSLFLLISMISFFTGKVYADGGVVVNSDTESFYGDTSLQTVTIGDDVTEIRSAMFENCTSLKAVYGGANVTSIEDEITAAYNNQSVQPSAEITATFSIPNDFDADNAAVLYVSEDGVIENIHCYIDKENRQITAKLSHFSTYVVAERVEAESFNIMWITIPLAVVILGAMACLIIILKKKKAR